MSARKQRKLLSADEMRNFEAGTERICKDFEVFCGYITENQVKLSIRTGNIGKKDCFTLNQQLSFQESYEKGTYTQERYAVIDFFLYFAYQFGILKDKSDGKSGIMAAKGRNYERFAGFSKTARYLMFLSYILSDHPLIQSDYHAREDYREMDALLRFCAVSKPGALVPIQDPEKTFLRYNNYMYSAFLRIFQIMNICDTKYLPKPKQSQAYLTPLVESVTVREMGILTGKVFERYRKKGDSEWIGLLYEGELLEYYLKAFGDFLTKEEARSMLELLENEQDSSLAYPQIYELEIRLRGYRCERTIRIGSSSLLAELHDYIQKLYNFDDDHLYCFTFGAGRRKMEFARPEADGEYSAADVTLGELGLVKGQEFTYLFDFGDKWLFTIKVKGCQEGTLAEPEMIKAVGEPPEQYPNWDEEEWEEEDRGE